MRSRVMRTRWRWSSATLVAVVLFGFALGQVAPLGAALARVKTWGNEVLTAVDLNGEFNNILNNAISLISPLTGNLAAGGNDITGLDELQLNDAAADASAVGRLRRNGTNLTWHDGTSSRNIGTGGTTALSFSSPMWWADPGGKQPEFVYNDGTNLGEPWWAFDGSVGAGSEERIYTRFYAPKGYVGGTITVKLITKAASATSGTYVFQLAAKTHTVGAASDEALTTIANTGAVTTDGTAGETSEGTITWSSTLPTAGKMVTLELTRLNNDAGDTITTDIRLLAVYLEW